MSDEFLISHDDLKVVVEAPGIEVVKSAEPTGVQVVVPIAGPRGYPGGPDAGPRVYRQLEPSASWVIEHDLGWRPELSLFLDDSPNEQVWADIQSDHFVTVITLPAPATGTAYLR